MANIGDAEGAAYMAIDPGGTTGWASFDESGEISGFGKIKGGDEFLDWLETVSVLPKVFIIEQYRSRPGTKINSWSTGPTQQHIGAIKRTLRKRGIDSNNIHFQEPSPCLKIGLMWAGLPTPKKKTDHVPDDHAAIAHGTYYLQKNGIKKSRLKK